MAQRFQSRRVPCMPPSPHDSTAHLSNRHDWCNFNEASHLLPEAMLHQVHCAIPVHRSDNPSASMYGEENGAINTNKRLLLSRHHPQLPTAAFALHQPNFGESTQAYRCNHYPTPRPNLPEESALRSLSLKPENLARLACLEKDQRPLPPFYPMKTHSANKRSNDVRNNTHSPYWFGYKGSNEAAAQRVLLLDRLQRPLKDTAERTFTAVEGRKFALSVILSDLRFTEPMCQLIYAFVHSQIDRLSATTHSEGLKEGTTRLTPCHLHECIIALTQVNRPISPNSQRVKPHSSDYGDAGSARQADSRGNPEDQDSSSTSAMIKGQYGWHPPLTPCMLEPSSPSPPTLNAWETLNPHNHTPPDDIEDRTRALWAAVATAYWYFFRLIHYVRQNGDDIDDRLAPLIKSFEPYSLAAACALVGIKTEERRAISERRRFVGSLNFLFKEAKLTTNYNNQMCLEECRQLREASLVKKGAYQTSDRASTSPPDGECKVAIRLDHSNRNTDPAGNCDAVGRNDSSVTQALSTMSTAESLGMSYQNKTLSFNSIPVGDRLAASSPMNSMADDPFSLSEAIEKDQCASGIRNRDGEESGDLEKHAVNDLSQWNMVHVESRCEKEFTDDVRLCEQMLLSATNYSLAPPSPLQHIDFAIKALVEESTSRFTHCKCAIPPALWRWTHTEFAASGDHPQRGSNRNDGNFKNGTNDVVAITHIRPLAYDFAIGVSQISSSVYFPPELVSAMCVYAAGTVVDIEMRFQSTLDVDHGAWQLETFEEGPMNISKSIHPQDNPYDIIHSLLSLIQSSLQRVHGDSHDPLGWEVFVPYCAVASRILHQPVGAELRQLLRPTALLSSSQLMLSVW
eukprot:GHVN01057174.1.p1 GENE.GHVN01057174.1~~GHVN01057174.1.p1  ORF type:complete len:854 (-),score=104.59 GHVN01057174.1:282-2843(-)